MDVQPAHLNRNSFRDFFKGLVTLEIILDLSFGFPINNIISLPEQDGCYELGEYEIVTGLGAGGRTPVFLAKRCLKFQLDSSVIGSNDFLVKLEG